MPITTWMIAKGVPPRVHEPKVKAKPWVKQANTTQPSCKKVASKSESNKLEEMTKLRPRKKQNTTCQWIEESESEVELVNNAEPPEEEVKSVDKMLGSEEVPTEQEVSTSHIFERNTHQHLGQSWWPSMWCWPCRKTCQEEFDTQSPHHNVRQGHCEVWNKRG